MSSKLSGDTYICITLICGLCSFTSATAWWGFGPHLPENSCLSKKEETLEIIP